MLHRSSLDHSQENHDPSILSMAAECVAKSRRCIIVTGAGISCSAGIPDFRSENGLYQVMKTRYPNHVLKGQDMFDTILFKKKETQKIFFTLMAELRAAIDGANPTTTHRFIKLLHDRKRLVRNYTQNIDGLEEKAGLIVTKNNYSQGRVLQLHGNLSLLRCELCNSRFPFDTNGENFDTLRGGQAPPCTRCVEISDLRFCCGKRPIPIGALRPDIVLYGEHHPDGDVISHTVKRDISRNPDLLIIIGTSLKVSGLKALVKALSNSVHRSGGKVIFVNKTIVSDCQWARYIDYHIIGDSDSWVEDLKIRQPNLWLKQTGIVSSFRVHKPKKPSKSSTDAEKPYIYPIVKSESFSSDSWLTFSSQDSLPLPVPSSQESLCALEV